MRLSISIDSKALEKTRIQISALMRHPQPFLRRFHVYMIGQTGKTFRKLRRGGTYRGVTWKPFSLSYQVRPSGAPVTASSHLLRDTGRLAAAAGTTARYLRGGTSLEMITANVDYAAKQQEKRPFLFFADEDVEEAGRILQRYLDEQLR